MKLIPDHTNFDFLGRRRIAMVISLLLVAISIGSIAIRGLNFGIDFTGGVLIEVGYPQPADLSEIRDALASGPYSSAIVQHFGSSQDVLIRLVPTEDEATVDTSSEVLKALSLKTPGVEMRRVEFVGPQVGEELTEQGGLAMLYALIGILVYVAFRFQWKFGMGAIAALAHDVVVTLGFFSIFQLNFDLPVLAALLAVIGYSLNDTIVIFDRIRENFLRLRKAEAIEVMNVSVNQTLSRTLMTGVTTLLVLFALYLIGGEALVGFSITLIVGIVVGTYSSVYVASAAALSMGVTREDLLPPTDENEQQQV